LESRNEEMTMAKPKKGKGTQGGAAARSSSSAGSRQADLAGAVEAEAEASDMHSDTGSMAGAVGGDSGSRQSALPEAELPIQSGGERIGVGHHRQGRQTGGLHQPSIADDLAAESAPDQGSAPREGKRKD